MGINRVIVFLLSSKVFLNGFVVIMTCLIKGPLLHFARQQIVFLFPEFSNWLVRCLSKSGSIVGPGEPELAWKMTSNSTANISKHQQTSIQIG